MNQPIDAVGQPSSVARSRVGAWMAEHKLPVRIVLGAIWLAGFVWFLETKGLVQARDWVFVFLVTALLIVSVGDFDRWRKGVFVDWLPFAAILFAYDWLRGLTDTLNWKVHYTFAIHADKAMFGSPIPSVYLQHRYYHPPSAAWYDYAAFSIYLTHFFMTLVVAAVLWKVAYPRFKRWRNLVLTASAAGGLTYLLFPAAPPWLAYQKGYLHGSVVKVISQLYQHTHINVARAAFEHNQDFVNPTAAIPSLHAAYPMLLALLTWTATRNRVLRALTAIYVPLMGITLVYTGEHYVVDIIIGWIYAVVTFLVVVWAERAWARRRARRTAARTAAEPVPAGAGGNGQVRGREPEPVTTYGSGE